MTIRALSHDVLATVLGTVQTITKKVRRSHISGQTLLSSQGYVEEIKVLLLLCCFALFSMTLQVGVRPKEQVNFGYGKNKMEPRNPVVLW